MSIIASLLALVPKLLSFVNAVMDVITAEKLKQAGINEQILAQMAKREEVRKAADNARKNPPAGNIIDHL